MNTKINLTYKNVPYCLEYDRMSVKTLEANGFSIQEFIKKPMSNIEMAFAGAFIKNHRKVKQDLILEIYGKCKDKDKLINTLITMIQETYESLFEDTNDSDEGNAEWEVMDLSPKTSQK
jgi:hypothetical protein